MTPPIAVQPWAEWAEALSVDLRPETAYAVRQLLDRLFELAPTGNVERAALGVAGRRLLAFALNAERNDPWMVADAAKAVSATYDTDPVGADRLLRRLFTPERLARFGAQELPRVAEPITALVAQAPGLVRDLYVAAFSYEETSKDETQLVPSAVLPLRSNRKQDYEGGLYVLGKEYPTFLATAAGAATAALIAVVEQYRRRERYPVDVGPEQTFDVHGVEARVQADGSTIWDELASYRHDDQLQMLDAFARRLAILATGAAPAPPPSRGSSGRRAPSPTTGNAPLPDTGARAQLEEIVATVIFENRHAVIWRRLLEAGTAHPAAIRDLLAPLAWAAPLLIATETTVAAGAFLTAIYPVLTPDEREQVEYTILHLTPLEGGDRVPDVEGTRARLLGCLPEELITTGEARSALAEFQARDAVPENRPRAPLITIRHGPAPGRTVEEEWLADKGIPVDAEPNRALLALARIADEFAATHLNGRPTPDQAIGVLPTLQALLAGLTDRGASADVRKSAELALARACARIAQGAPETCDGTLGTFVTSALLSASRSDHPLPGHGDLIEGLNGWSPAPRIEAAQGLPELCRHSACVSREVRSAVERLSEDPAPAVRAQLFWRLTRLWNVDRAFVWEALERAAASESSAGVLQAALRGGLAALQGVDPSRVAALTAAIADRLPADKASKELRDDCAALFTGLAVWHATPLAAERIARIARDPATHADEARHVLQQLRGMLVMGDPLVPDAQRDAARSRSLDIVTEIVTRAAARFAALHAEVEGAHPAPPPDAAIEQFRELASVLDGAGSQLYFVAKDAAKRNGEEPAGEDEEPAPTPAQLARLYTEAGSIIDALAEVGLGHLAHHLLELLEIFAPHDPAGVFLRVARVVRAARASSYQYDSLAQGLVVRLIERYLAEYQDVIEASVECRAALLDVLDIFVQAGWPEARRLSYRLDEVYR